MKKLFLILILFFGFIASLLPISGLIISKGFANPDKPWGISAVYGGARFRMVMQNYGSAAVALQKALEVWPADPRCARGTYWVAFCHERSDQPEQAIEWYRRYLETYPAHEWSEQAKVRVEKLEGISR